MASVRIQHGLFVLLGMLWLRSALSKPDGVELDLVPKYLASCGENLTLECKVKANEELEIKRFYWMEKKDICEWMKDTNETGMECESEVSQGSVKIYNFSLTIFDIQPKHKGTYHCKLQYKGGAENGKTVLRVQKCVGSATTDGASCTFNNVFPKPTVEWIRGTENLTHLATTDVTENAEGYFTVVSTIKVVKDPSNTAALNCSLLMPIENEMNETIVQAVRSLSVNGSYMLIAHWFGVLLAIALGILMF